MKIVIIGTGNVATVLGKKLAATGHSIVQLYGRNKKNTDVLATELSAAAVYEWNDITTDAELYLLALPDQLLKEAALYLQLTDQLVVHTAGSVSMNVLQNISSRFGVFYPFQTIRKEIMPATEIPLMVDASDEISRQQLMDLGESISGSVRIVNDAQRAQYHLSAVIVNNFSNYLYAVTEKYCRTHALDFKLLLPLIDETARRIHYSSPRAVQTGPAIRQDTDTIERHLVMLEDDPALQDIYRAITEGILSFPW